MEISRYIKKTKRGTYRLFVWLGRKRYYSKTFKTLEEAIAARDEFLEEP